MPVVATPVIKPSSTTLTCDDQFRLRPRITELYGTCIPTKKRAVLARQNALGELHIQLLNQDGNPINLTSCGFADGGTGHIRFAFKETVNPNPSNIAYIDGTVEDATVGKVMVTIPPPCLRHASVLDGEVGVYLDDPDPPTNGVLAFSNTFYIWVDRTLFPGAGQRTSGLMPLDDVRIYMRDNGPEENLLIDDFEFDLAEYCQGAATAVRYWNESQPPIDVFFDTSSYPFRDYWIRYIAGYVMNMAARRYLRNHLPYQAANVQIDDQNKFREYAQLGQQLMEEYREWVKQKKAQINLEAAITYACSPYTFAY